MIIKLELEFSKTTKSMEEVDSKLHYLFNSYHGVISNFVLMLLRLTGASSWELKKLEVTNSESIGSSKGSS